VLIVGASARTVVNRYISSLDRCVSESPDGSVEVSVTSHHKRVRSLKECDSSGARDGDGELYESHVPCVGSSQTGSDWFCDMQSQ
jgi:hypothetical protein